MSRPVAKEVADVSRQLRDEGLLDEWGEAFGLRMAHNIAKRRRDRVRQSVAVKEAAE